MTRNDSRLVATLTSDLVELCSVPSPSRSERQIADYLRARFEALGMSVREDDAASSTGGTAGNLIAELPGGLPERIVLAAHMDTVPLTPGRPLQPIVDGTIVRTDGTQILGADDKAGVAVVLQLLQAASEKEFDERPTLVAVITVCEELGLLGAKHLNVEALEADRAYSFDGEVPVGEVITKAVFKERFEMVVTGRAAHAALEPERGVHAIKVAAAVVMAVPVGRVAEDQVLNIGSINGGGPTNVVPAEVTIVGELRAFTEDRLEELAARVGAAAKAAAEEHGTTVSFKRERLYDGYELADSDETLQRLAAISERNGVSLTPVASIGGSDTSVLNGKGLPTANVGIAMNEIHSVNEWIDVREMARVVRWVADALGVL